MRALGYVRVSTEDQAREGLSLGVQKDRITAFCTAKGFVLNVQNLYEDAGRSAKDTNRPALRELLRQVREGDVVVACKLDRLFRNTRDALETAEMLRARGAQLVSIGESIDTSTPAGNFFFTLVAALATLEREQTSERTRQVMRSLRDGGRKYGPPPFGKVEQGGRLVSSEEQQAALGRIVELRASGLSMRQIASLMKSEGVPTPRGGEQWHHSTVRHLLRRAT